MKILIQSSLLTFTVAALVAACSHKSNLAKDSSRPKSTKDIQRQLASISDDEFADRLAELGLTGIEPQELKDLKKDYEKNVGKVDDHARYLKCIPAGETQERELKMYEQCDTAGEQQKFMQLGRRMQVVQEKNRTHHAAPEVDGKHLHRGFHAKAHGCLYGSLNVTPPADRPEWTRAGLFEFQRNHLVWTRFSNGTGLIQGDYKAEPRGLAIKVVGTKGPRATLYATKSEKQTQDFLMTNKPIATTPDPVSFIEFAEAGADGKLPLFIAKNRWIFTILGDLVLNKRWVPNVAMIDYWSGVPISIGKTADGKPFPAKFFVTPCEGVSYLNDKTLQADPGVLQKLTKKSEFVNYGREKMKALSETHEICYDLKFQQQTSVDRTSIEDGLDEWTVEESPPVTVAQLILPKQNFDNPEQNKLCEQMHFNPWNSLDSHLPMSDTNQARGVVYSSSAQHRTGKDWTKKAAPEPTEASHPLYRK